VNALYDTIGKGYANHRQADPHIAAVILDALGDAQSVVVAGTGSYEPRDRHVVAVEPAATMIAQRVPGAAEVIQGSAEKLPFADKSFDAVTAFLTTHHWFDLDAGLREMARVSLGPCIFLDHDMGDLRFRLLDDYFPDMAHHLKALLPLDAARAAFDIVETVPVPVPHDCTDGFLCAYWQRPHAYLDANVRAAISFFAIANDVEMRIVRLRCDVDDGTWMRRNGHILNEAERDFGYRLVVAEMG
jgi:SAM-dependent methyltransferase